MHSEHFICMWDEGYAVMRIGLKAILKDYSVVLVDITYDFSDDGLNRCRNKALATWIGRFIKLNPDVDNFRHRIDCTAQNLILIVS